VQDLDELDSLTSVVVSFQPIRNSSIQNCGGLSNVTPSMPSITIPAYSYYSSTSILWCVPSSFVTATIVVTTGGFLAIMELCNKQTVLFKTSVSAFVAGVAASMRFVIESRTLGTLDFSCLLQPL
jgi:hypothetical protein